jgi:large subunit ribosomal protein L13
MERTVGTYLLKVRRAGVRWIVINAEGCVLGRLAARAARVLMGKDSPDYTPHVDHRGGVIIINAEKVRLTGRKWDTKVYRRHSGFPGGLKELSARRVLETWPERLLRDAIVGMLPKGRLGERLAQRVKVYTGSTHPHTAQHPEVPSLSH